jgi:hypothetical protein
MMQADQSALAYLARRDVSVQWRDFLRALLETLDATMQRDSRDSLLRAIGQRFAAAMPLPASDTLAALEMRMNEALAAASWGHVLLELDQRENTLRVVHSAGPCIPAPGDEAGAWLAPVLEGLYSNWFGAQPGGEGDTGITVRLLALEPGLATLRYGS